MSDHGQRYQPPTHGGGDKQPPTTDDPQHAGNSVQADREWALNRIRQFQRGQADARKNAAVMRKAEEARKSPPAPPGYKPGDWRARLTGGGASEAPTRGRAAIPQSGGAPLPGEVRAKMEGQLGADLSGVTVHTGAESAQAADRLGARAFTDGARVHFAPGAFAPDTKEGDRLIGHELTHVVQGQRSAIPRKADDQDQADGGAHDPEGAQHEVSQPGDPAEQEADAAGDKIADNLHGGDKQKGKKDGEAAKGETKEKAKLQGVGLKVHRMPSGDDPQLKMAKKYDLNLQSPTSKQILDNMGMTCEAFIGAFRKGSLKAEFPQEYLQLTVQQALDADKSKVRKLLIDGRFAK